MKKAFLFLLVVAGTSVSWAGQNSLLDVRGLHDVVVPTVWGTLSGGELVQGMLFYDGSTSSLKFVGDSSTPVIIGSTLGGSVISSAADDKIERATIAEGATCTVSPCSITRQSGTWISSVTRTGTGAVTINFATNTFSSAPTCTISSWATDTYFTSAITTSGVSLGSNVDFRDLNIICIGPR